MNGQPESSPPSSPKQLLQLVLPLAIVLVGLVLLRISRPAAPLPEDLRDVGDSAAGVVTVEVTRPKFDSIETETSWFDGMTVRDATDRLFSSRWRGQGPMALLESLLETPNQGADGLNWQYEVNGQYADRSAAVYPLQPGDRVLWKFAPYE